MTFSLLVPASPATGHLAVASQYAPPPWASVPWRDMGGAGIGVVATQAFTVPKLRATRPALMRAGHPAPDALRQLLQADAGVTIRDKWRSWTQRGSEIRRGTRCRSDRRRSARRARHRVGQHARQRRSAAGNGAWLENADGDLTHPSWSAYTPADEQVVTSRGRQSAAVLVVDGAPTDAQWMTPSCKSYEWTTTRTRSGD